MFQQLKAAAAAAAIVATAALTAPASASVMVFNTEAAFRANAGVVATDGLDDLWGAAPSSVLARPQDYTIATGSAGLFTVGSWNDAWLSTNDPGDSLVFRNFDTPLHAFGGLFFGSDMWGLPSGGALVFAVTDLSGTFEFAIDASDAATFVGFHSDHALLSIGVSSGTPGSWVTANNILLELAAPSAEVMEPAPLALSGIGLLALFLCEQTPQSACRA
jgi:hypothetical protein